MALDYTDYDALDAADKAILDQYTPQLRASMGELHRTLNRIEQIQDVYTSSVSAILAGITTGQGVRDPSGLANADELTRDETQTLQSYLDTIISNVGSLAHKEMMVKAAGLQNTLSE